MQKCLICNESFKNKRGLSTHIRKHKITISEYKKKFNLICYCPLCGKEIHCENKTGHCNSCRNRTKENNPFFNKSHSKKTINILKIKCRKASKKLWENLEYRQKILNGISKPRPKEFALEQSKRVKKWYEQNPIQKDLRSKCMKNSWKTGKITKNNYSSNHSHLEKELLNLLKEIDPSFKEKITLKIDNRWFFPDIINLNKKLIVEFYGDYWHCNPNIYKKHDDFNFGLKVKDIWNHDNERIGKFKREGYKVIIIWETNFKENKEQVINEIMQYLV